MTATVFAQNFYLFAGTYTGKGSRGIYVYRFNAATGNISPVSHTDTAVNPSYLAIAPDGKHIYAVNETGRNQPGSVSAYAFDRNSGQLTLLNSQPSGGDDPCFVAITKNGKWLSVANYSGGNFSVFPISKDGSLQPYADLVQHEGSSANKTRQEKAHVHQTIFSPDEKYLFTNDLGTDKVSIYKTNAAAGKLLQTATPTVVAVTPGNGPRHLTFAPNGKFVYLIEELSGTVAAYAYNNGKLTFLQRLATHPSDFKGTLGSADIHLSPDGKFLYASNRGDENTITIFSVAANGKLKWKGYQSTMGKAPRNFIIDPTGNYLLVANQNTNNIVVFKRNPQTGMLRATGKQIEIPNPVCLQLLK